MENKINKIKEYPLGDNEIKKYLPTVPVMKYSKLSNYKTIEELLPENKTYCILLYEWSPNVGHWVALLRYNDQYEYFDSYGNKLDDPLNWVDLGIRKELDQNIPYLTNLLKGKKILVNKIKYQKEDPEIATCGRWCIFRILSNKNEDLNLKEFHTFFKKIKKDLLNNNKNDNIISIIISLL
jgi:hypothetical protein